MLELNEELLKKYGFKDVWKIQKEVENSGALKILHKRLKEVDNINDSYHGVNRKKWEELFRGVLAGNIFDSGATAVQDLLADNEKFGLRDALQRIQSRPWLIDSFEQFMKRLENVRIKISAIKTKFISSFLGDTT